MDPHSFDLRDGERDASEELPRRELDVRQVIGDPAERGLYLLAHAAQPIPRHREHVAPPHSRGWRGRAAGEARDPSRDLHGRCEDADGVERGDLAS